MPAIDTFPIQISDVNVSGVCIGSVDAGEIASIQTRFVVTSAENYFHGMMADLDRVIGSRIRSAGYAVALEEVNHLLVIVRTDKTADVWINNIPRAINARVGRELPAMSPVYDSDIIDITGYDFYGVEINAGDQVIFFFREGWKFGFFADFNSGQSFDRPKMAKDIARLFRELRYSKLYDSIKDSVILYKIIESGWFPFIEIIGPEYDWLFQVFSNDLNFEKFEQSMLNKFDDVRIENIFDRWMKNEILQSKEKILRSGIESFKREDAVAAVKIILSEIEGIMEQFYISEIGRPSANTDQLIKYISNRVSKSAQSNSTLYFPRLFSRYLHDCCFKGFERGSLSDNSKSRHSVGHGAVHPEGYTQIRSLQAILTLDQIVYYIN